MIRRLLEPLGVRAGAVAILVRLERSIVEFGGHVPQHWRWASRPARSARWCWRWLGLCRSPRALAHALGLRPTGFCGILQAERGELRPVSSDGLLALKFVCRNCCRHGATKCVFEGGNATPAGFSNLPV